MTENNETLSWSEPFKIRLGDLVNNPTNPKTSDSNTVERLKDSVDTLGVFQTIAVDSDGISLIDGHQRLATWLKHKGPDFIVEAKKASRKLTEEEIRKLVMYSGRGTLGQWDYDVLANNYDPDELIEWGGFTEDELDLGEDDEGVGIGAGEGEGAGGVNAPFFSVNGVKHSITSEELELLVNRVTAYIDMNGSSYGFIQQELGE